MTNKVFINKASASNVPQEQVNPATLESQGKRTLQKNRNDPSLRPQNSCDNSSDINSATPLLLLSLSLEYSSSLSSPGQLLFAFPTTSAPGNPVARKAPQPFLRACSLHHRLVASSTGLPRGPGHRAPTASARTRATPAAPSGLRTPRRPLAGAPRGRAGERRPARLLCSSSPTAPSHGLASRGRFPAPDQGQRGIWAMAATCGGRKAMHTRGSLFTRPKAS